MKKEETPSIFKDRYSYVILVFTIAVLSMCIAVMLLKNEKNKHEASYIGLFGAFMFSSVMVFLLKAQAKAHLTEEQKEQVKNGTIMFKPENNCGWHADPSLAEKGFDGIKILKTRYKVTDGADVYISPSGKVVALGPGTKLIQKLRKAGKETESIQNDDCWK